MLARNLLENASFTPETLTAIFRAYDAAWAEVAHLFPEGQETARTRLAHAILLVANDDSRDPEVLKNDALQVLALALGKRQ
jgi:hypothetical protein